MTLLFCSALFNDAYFVYFLTPLFPRWESYYVVFVYLFLLKQMRCGDVFCVTIGYWILFRGALYEYFCFHFFVKMSVFKINHAAVRKIDNPFLINLFCFMMLFIQNYYCYLCIKLHPDRKCDSSFSSQLITLLGVNRNGKQYFELFSISLKNFMFSMLG